MASATYWQRGESLDYVNSGNTIIAANTIVALTGRIGVIGTDIKPGEKGSIHVSGVYEIAKTGTAALTMGQEVYFDGTGITNTSSGNTPAGFAAAAAASGDTVCLVKIG